MEGAERKRLPRVHQIAGIEFQVFKANKIIIIRVCYKIIMKNLNNKITFYCVYYTITYKSQSISKLTLPTFCFCPLRLVRLLRTIKIIMIINHRGFNMCIRMR
jgi:hypothetical protein